MCALLANLAGSIAAVHSPMRRASAVRRPGARAGSVSACVRPLLRREPASRRERILALSPASLGMDAAGPHLDNAAAICSWAAQKYADELADQPVLTHVATATILFLGGDAYSQLKGAERAYDLRRAASMGLFAACYTGVFQAWWFDVLNGALPGGGTPIEELGTAVAKTAACQLGPIPLAYLPLLFAVQGVVRGFGWERTVEHAKASYLPLLTRNWKFWWPVQIVQFAVVPSEWQLPFVCTAALVWAVILSSAAEPAPSAAELASALAVSSAQPGDAAAAIEAEGQVDLLEADPSSVTVRAFARRAATVRSQPSLSSSSERVTRQPLDRPRSSAGPTETTSDEQVES